MYVINQFKNNLIHPRKAAFFRLQRMQRNIGYLFFLSFILMTLFLPRLFSSSEIWQTASPVLIPIFTFFYYAVIALIMFLSAYGLAALGLLFKKALSRRLTFPHLWALAANSLTWPTVVVGSAQVIFGLGTYASMIFIISSIIFYLVMLTAIPKPRPSKKNGHI